MTDIEDYKNTPVGSLLTIPENEARHYIQGLPGLPGPIVNILMSETIGAFITGLTKAYNIDSSLSPKVALNILRIAYGERSFMQLPSLISSELQLSIDEAQKMADEIEKDVFGPVRIELDEFLRKQKTGRASSASTPIKPRLQTKNVLNLKEITAKPLQTQLPPKPIQPSLPPRRPVPPKMPPSPIEPIRFT